MRIRNTTGFTRIVYYTNANGIKLGPGATYTNADTAACLDPRLRRDIEAGHTSIQFDDEELELFEFLRSAHDNPRKADAPYKARRPAEINHEKRLEVMEARRRLRDELSKPPPEGRPEFDDLRKKNEAEAPAPEAAVIEKATHNTSLADLLRSNTVLEEGNGKT